MQAVDKVLDLFLDLGADDDQCEFPYLFASGLAGFAKNDMKDEDVDMKPLFNAIVEHVPPPVGDPEKPLQLQVTTLDYSEYLGRIVIGRIHNGTIQAGQQAALVKDDGSSHKSKSSKLLGFEGLPRVEWKESSAGNLVAVAGFADANIGETITCPNDPQALPLIKVDEPTLQMTFCVNDSPFAGRQGDYVTSRQVRDRLIHQAVRASDVTKATSEEASKRRRVIVFFVTLALLFLAGGSIAAVVSAQRVTSTPTTFSPTTSPTSFVDVVTSLEDQELLVYEALVGISFDDGAALGNVSSAQFRAFRSLALTEISSLDDTELKTRYGLAVLYYATNGDEWEKNDGWLSWERSYCTEWFFNGCILCPSLCDDSGNLQSMRLVDNNLQGSLPPEIALISPQSLTHVSFSRNANLVSTIPELMIDSFSGLQQLELDSTGISGPIPSKLGELIQLTTLDLDRSRLTGSIPKALANLTKLETLSLSQITTLRPSSIPSEVYSLTTLVSLKVDGSKFIGTLSSEIGKLTRLVSMSFSKNALTGTIPSEIGQLSLVRALELSNNKFTGSIPSTIDQLAGAIQLFLEYNELTGVIPQSLCNMTGLKDFRAAKNKLTGPLPPGMERMVSMKTINVGGNNLTGSVPFDSFAHWSQVKSLRCNRNQFTGSFNPGASFWQLRDLGTILLDHNRLTGTLTDSIGTAHGLRELDLSSNKLTGSIPAVVGSVTTLHTLDLSNNALSSTLPTELVGLSGLTELHLQNNSMLSGTVPVGFGQLENLREVNISATSIVGDAPFCVADELSIPCDAMTCHCCKTNFCANPVSVVP